jgi:hypothetical protein
MTFKKPLQNPSQVNLSRPMQVLSRTEELSVEIKRIWWKVASRWKSSWRLSRKVLG